MTEILLFVTTVKNEHHVQQLRPALHARFGRRWHFDLADDIKVLRLIGSKWEAEAVCQVLNRFGFECLEIEADLVVPVTVADKAAATYPLLLVA